MFVVYAIVAVALLIGLVLIIFIPVYGKLWFQAFMSDADVSFSSLIGMGFRQVNPRVIVQAKIMTAQAGLDINRRTGISTARLEAHYLAGGNVMNVVHAIIAAHRADIDLDFDRAAAIDLAGRDVMDAVRTSVHPKVIDCPDPRRSGKTTLSAIAKNGVELRIRARVTVRTNLEQLIGGATEETVIARVGEGIITAIGSSDTHLEVLETPDRITRAVLARGLDAHTAFAIVSIDIADIDVGENIGARLQADQAEADTRVARAKAERATRRSRGRRTGDEGQGRRESSRCGDGRGGRAPRDGRGPPQGEHLHDPQRITGPPAQCRTMRKRDVHDKLRRRDLLLATFVIERLRLVDGSRLGVHPMRLVASAGEIERQGSRQWLLQHFRFEVLGEGDVDDRPHRLSRARPAPAPPVRAAH